MFFVLLLLAAVTPHVASGRVVRVAGADTAAAAGALVVLHRVGVTVQGAIDSVRADANGRFAIRFDADTADAYLVSARWAGVEYFAPPLLGTADDRTLTIVVSDTSVSAPVAVSARHVVVSGPASDGTRTVVDLVIIGNTGPRTRVPVPDSIPSWFLLLPPSASNVRVAESDFSATAFDRHGDTLLLHAPIPPGERQVFIEYQLTPGAREFAFPAAAVASLNVMTEEPVRLPGMVAEADTTVNDRRFHRWTTTVTAPRVFTMRFPGTTVPRWLVPVLLVVLAGGLVVTAVVARRRVPPRVKSAESRQQLIDAIVRLDNEYARTSPAEDPAAWTSYLARRAALKRRLQEMVGQ